MTRLIVFDLDGTLIDSRRDLADSANVLIVERGGAPQPVDAIASMVGEGAALLVRRALVAAGLEPKIDEALPRFLKLYAERLLMHTRLYDGVAEMLDKLSVVARLAILTNKPQRHTESILAGLDIDRFFTDVIGGDTTYGRKPDPAGLHSLMVRAKAPPEATALIGDSVIDLRTARAARVRCCLVRYGFGFASAADEMSPADLVVETATQLPDVLSDL